MKRAAPYLLFAAVTLAVFWKFLLFGQTLYAMPALEQQLGLPAQEPSGWFRSLYRHTRISDNLVVLAGQLRIYNEGLKANELHLWNPHLACGLPCYADPMLHPFYPPNLILHRLLPVDAAYEWGLALHLFFSGVAMHLLLLAAGRSGLASTAGALVWMLWGYSAMWFSTSVLAGVMVFGPLAMRSLLRGLETRDRSHGAKAAVLMGMAILGSHPQHAVLLFLFLLGYLMAAAIGTRESRAFILRFGALFALLSVGVGLAEILPRLDTIEHGYRAEEFDRGSLYVEPFRLTTYASGLLLGKVYYPGPGWESEFPVFAGLAAAGLALVGAFRRRTRPLVRYAAAAGAASLAIAFIAPVGWVYSKIPILGLSPPSRCLFLAGFSLAILAGEGLDALAEDPGWALRAAAGISAAYGLALVAGIGPVRLSNGAAVETGIGFALVTGALALARRSPRAAAALGLSALLFELLPPFLQFNPHVDPALLSRVPEPVRRLEAPGGPWRATGLLGTRATSSKSDEWTNDLIAGNNLLALYGVDNVSGFEAILPRRTVEFADAAGNRVSPAGRTLEFTRFESPLVDFLGLRRLLFPARVRVPARFRKIADFGTVSLFDNPAALPRARMVPDVRSVADDVEAAREIRAPGFDPARQTIIEGSGPVEASPGGTVGWKERSTDRERLEVRSAGPGVLVVAEPDYPGWEAWVDGQPAAILPANLAFRAVAVPPGAHAVEFRFCPSPVYRGLIGSALSLLLSLGTACYRRRP